MGAESRSMSGNELGAVAAASAGPMTGLPARFKRRDGFTLIELMTVVIVIGILSVVAIPSFLKATARAKTASCRSNQRHLGAQSTLYAIDQRIADEVVPVADLLEAGYCTEQLCDCSLDQDGDHEDYAITIEDGVVVDVECLIDEDEHTWAP